MNKDRINYIFAILILVIFSLTLCSCAKAYTITFKFNCDEYEDKVVELKRNEKIDYPNPIRNDYDFKGWYINKNCTIEYNENLAKEDKTLYAKWDEKEFRYKIEYNLNNGTCDNLIKSFDNCANVTLPIPTRQGYEFLGWYENDTLVSTIINRDYKLEAKWELLYLDVNEPNIDRVRQEQTTYLNVVYKNAGGHTLKMDMYLPALKENETCPALFIYYGGGWIMGGKEDIYTIQPIIDYAIENKIAVIVPNYRLAYEATFPNPVEDAIDAIRFCVKYNNLLGIDLNNIGTLGYSSGAHLALMAAFANASDDFKSYYSKDTYQYSVKYVLDMYGPAVYDLASLSKLSPYGMMMLTKFIGSTNISDAKFKNVMPSYYIKNNQDIDVYIVHGKSDTLVPCSQSELLYQLLVNNNIDASLTLVEGAEHAFNILEDEDMVNKTREVYQEMMSFIKKEAID